MAPRSKKKLDEKFNIDTPIETLPESVAVVPVSVPLSDAQVIAVDADKARVTLNELIDTSLTALSNLIRVAKETESPRAYEVVATMIKTTADISKDLLDIQKKKQDLRPDDDPGVPTSTSIGTQQNIFVGSTDDLLRAIAQAGITGKATVIDAELVETD